MTPQFIANRNIVAEEFDGETVLIDVSRGLYFSLQGAATELWKAFAEPRTEADVLETLCGQLSGCDRAGLASSLQKMHECQLLVAADASTPGPASHYTASSASFSPPVVEVYSDLADLIAIDPVHEVDATAGWPMRPGNFPDVA